MKAPLTKAIFIVSLIAISMSCLAQQSNTMSFIYDANGNRTARQIVIGGSKGDACKSETKAPTFVDDFETLSVTLYPNPTEGRFCIEVNGNGDSGNLQARLTTTTGNVIYDKTIDNPTDCFDLTRHPAGIYLLELISNDKSHIWKVIKR